MRVVVASVEGKEEASQTKADFPRLMVVADARQALSKAAALIHSAPNTGNREVSTPTTILVDRQGMVRWLYRPERHIVRPSAADQLAAVDQYLGKR